MAAYLPDALEICDASPDVAFGIAPEVGGWQERPLRIEPPHSGITVGRSGNGASFPFPLAPVGVG
jgi:hypothetical protein